MERAGPAGSTRCLLGEHGPQAGGGPGVPPPRGQDTQPPACCSLGVTRLAPLPSKHAGTTFPVAPRLRFEPWRQRKVPAMLRSPQLLTGPPAAASAEPGPALSQQKLYPKVRTNSTAASRCRSHHTRRPRHEDPHAAPGAAEAAARQRPLSLGISLIIEPVSLPPPLDPLTHNPAPAAPARQPRAGTAESRPHGTTGINPGRIPAPHRRHGNAAASTAQHHQPPCQGKGSSISPIPPGQDPARVPTEGATG